MFAVYTNEITTMSSKYRSPVDDVCVIAVPLCWRQNAVTKLYSLLTIFVSSNASVLFGGKFREFDRTQINLTKKNC